MAKEKSGSNWRPKIQYEMLMRCAAKKDMRDWNRWRNENPDIKIWLHGYDLQGAKLCGADLQGAWLYRANLQGAELDGANLQGARLYEAKLQGASLFRANLQGAELDRANLQGARLYEAKLQGARLERVNLQRASLYEAKLQGAKLERVNLLAADFRLAQVDGSTVITNCWFDRKTNFTGVGLDAARVGLSMKAAFKDNIRRMHWKKWFATGNWASRAMKKIFVRPFWWMTGYGSSTSAVIYWFLALAFSFGVTYFVLDYNGGNVIEGLSVEGMPKGHTFLRAMYFSVVTMTTLGFGDMHALKTSYWGHVLLMVQVILGYVLLGALVTRLGIVFTGEAPAAAPTTKKKALKDWQKGLIFSMLVYALLAYLIFR